MLTKDSSEWLGWHRSAHGVYGGEPQAFSRGWGADVSFLPTPPSTPGYPWPAQAATQTSPYDGWATWAYGSLPSCFDPTG